MYKRESLERLLALTSKEEEPEPDFQGLKPCAFKRYGSNWIQLVQPRLELAVQVGRRAGEEAHVEVPVRLARDGVLLLVRRVGLVGYHSARLSSHTYTLFTHVTLQPNARFD